MPSIHDYVTQMGEADPAVAFKAYKDLAGVVTRASAPGHSDRGAVAAGLAVEFTAETPPAKDKEGRDIPPRPVHAAKVREQLARLLELVAGPQEVRMVAAALGDLEVREAARRVLAAIPGSESAEALVAALEDVGPDFRIGVVAALGRHAGSAAAVEALRRAAGDECPALRIAAVEALAAIPDPAHDALIADAARQATCPLLRGRAHAARIRLAGALQQVGNKPAARRICQAVRSTDAPAPQKEAAQRLLQAAG